MNGKRRHSVLVAALTGVVAWSAWLAVNEPSSDAAPGLVEVADPVKLTDRSVPAVAEAAPVITRPQPEQGEPRLALARTDLFPGQSWYVPPPPPPPTPYVPPPPPQAPPLPFSYMGRWQEAGQTTYYLAGGKLPVSVRAGQVLDGVWRLEPVVNGTLNFTYLPLNQTRSLRTGD